MFHSRDFPERDGLSDLLHQLNAGGAGWALLGLAGGREVLYADREFQGSRPAAEADVAKARRTGCCGGAWARRRR